RRLSRLCDKLQHERFPAGHQVIKQGEPPKNVYFVLSGTCREVKTLSERRQNRWPTGAQSWRVQTRSAKRLVPLVEHGPGAYFGHEGMLDLTPRNAMVTALTDLTLLLLDRRSFLGLVQQGELKLVGPPSAPAMGDGGDGGDDAPGGSPSSRQGGAAMIHHHLEAGSPAGRPPGSAATATSHVSRSTQLRPLSSAHLRGSSSRRANLDELEARARVVLHSDVGGLNDLEEEEEENDNSNLLDAEIIMNGDDPLLAAFSQQQQQQGAPDQDAAVAEAAAALDRRLRCHKQALAAAEAQQRQSGAPTAGDDRFLTRRPLPKARPATAAAAPPPSRHSGGRRTARASSAPSNVYRTAARRGAPWAVAARPSARHLSWARQPSAPTCASSPTTCSRGGGRARGPMS
ncbi:MAG: cyclic nucleotide-binding domain-containing protein, partial [Planctomycetota bacterium]